MYRPLVNWAVKAAEIAKDLDQAADDPTMQKAYNAEVAEAREVAERLRSECRAIALAMTLEGY